MKLFVGQIVENHLPGSKPNKPIVCRVVELNVAGTDMVRLTDARETQSDKWLIENNRTWAAPIENIKFHDSENCVYCHEDALVGFKF